jgi:hypothetical protein
LTTSAARGEGLASRQAAKPAAAVSSGTAKSVTAHSNRWMARSSGRKPVRSPVKVVHAQGRWTRKKMAAAIPK